VTTAGLLVVHDAVRGGQHDDAELTRRHQLGDPLLEFAVLDVEARGNDTALVDAAVQVNDDLAGAAVVDDLELTNVAWKGIELVSGL
jgi:hypothetical protein